MDSQDNLRINQYHQFILLNRILVRSDSLHKIKEFLKGISSNLPMVTHNNNLLKVTHCNLLKVIPNNLLKATLVSNLLKAMQVSNLLKAILVNNPKDTLVNKLQATLLNNNLATLQSKVVSLLVLEAYSSFTTLLQDNKGTTLQVHNLQELLTILLAINHRE